MDQATQQNAALVEQMAAAASSLKSQAQELVRAVAFFKVGGDGHMASLPKSAVRSSTPSTAGFKGAERRSVMASASARKPAAEPKPRPAPAASKPVVQTITAKVKVQPKPAPAGGDEDWETF
jgi:hypothetical protein